MNTEHVWNLINAWREGRGEAKGLSALQWWAEEVQWYEDYAPGSSGASHTRGVVAANWNDLDRYDRDTNTRTEVSDVPSRMCDLFERLGFAIEWSDQTSMCGGCNKCIQTEPDCMSWKPGFVVTDGDIRCQECAEDDAEEWLDECAEGDTHWTLRNIDPEEHGWTLAFPEHSFVYAKTLADEMKRKGFTRGEWLFTQSRGYECDVYVKDEAFEAYEAQQAANEAEQKRVTFKLCTPVAEARYHEAVECDEGWCPCCTDWTVETCEPDATDRKCEECGRSWAVGAEHALVIGLIEIR